MQVSSSNSKFRANKANTKKSAGPKTGSGKAIVSKNATRHAILSERMIVDGEDPDELEQLRHELGAALAPVGIVEHTLLERICVSIWRQRRLVRAETAALALAAQPRRIADDVSRELDLGLTKRLSEDELMPFDHSHARWCQSVVEEYEQLEEFDVSSVERSAPVIYRQLLADAEQEDLTVEGYLEECDRGLRGYLGEMFHWCRRELEAARQRPRILELAEHCKARNLVLPVHTLQLFARYQTTLDNQLFKALRALRDTQEWRIKQANSPEEDNIDDSVEEAA